MGICPCISKNIDCNFNKIETFSTNVAQENLMDFPNTSQLLYSKTKDLKISLDCFNLLNLLGTGAFGRVVLVEKKDTKKYYAMKIMNKDTICKRNQKVHTKSERSILENMHCNFIIHLHYAFQTPDKLFLVMDFMQGGELFFLLKKAYKFNEQLCQFYSAEIILALEYLHSKGIIYRDLKPENVLLNEDGNIKLCDFGLSKEGIIDGIATHSFCGTPEYMAPEIFLTKNHEHDKSADWWSLGVLIYEMLTGIPPFYGKDKYDFFKNSDEKNILFEIRKNFSPDVISLLKGLLSINPKTRLGYNDSWEIKKHPFFKNINWKELNILKTTPPFKPKLEGKTDLKFFDKMFIDESFSNSPFFDVKKPEENDFYSFFSYKNENFQISTINQEQIIEDKYLVVNKNYRSSLNQK